MKEKAVNYITVIKFINTKGIFVCQKILKDSIKKKFFNVV